MRSLVVLLLTLLALESYAGGRRYGSGFGGEDLSEAEKLAILQSSLPIGTRVQITPRNRVLIPPRSRAVNLSNGYSNAIKSSRGETRRIQSSVFLAEAQPQMIELSRNTVYRIRDQRPKRYGRFPEPFSTAATMKLEPESGGLSLDFTCEVYTDSYEILGGECTYLDLQEVLTFVEPLPIVRQ